jgi:hypothetical protein
MTIKIPEPNIVDTILKLFGKSRAILIPANVYKKYGPYVYARGKREGFLRALFRTKKRRPPDGWIYLDYENQSRFY